MRKKSSHRVTTIGVRPHLNEAGLSIVSMMIAVAITAIVVVMASNFAADLMRQSQRDEFNNELENLRSYIRRRLNCERTALPVPPACNDASGTALVDVFDTSNNILFSTTLNDARNYFGTFHVQVQCPVKIAGSNHQPLRFLARREVGTGVNRPAAPNPHLYNAATNTFQLHDWQDLFPGVSPCVVVNGP